MTPDEFVAEMRRHAPPPPPRGWWKRWFKRAHRPLPAVQPPGSLTDGWKIVIVIAFLGALASCHGADEIEKLKSRIDGVDSSSASSYEVRDLKGKISSLERTVGELEGSIRSLKSTIAEICNRPAVFNSRYCR